MSATFTSRSLNAARSDLFCPKKALEHCMHADNCHLAASDVLACMKSQNNHNNMSSCGGKQTAIAKAGSQQLLTLCGTSLLCQVGLS